MKIPGNMLKNIFEKKKHYEQDDYDLKQAQYVSNCRHSIEEYDRVREETQD